MPASQVYNFRHSMSPSINLSTLPVAPPPPLSSPENDSPTPYSKPLKSSILAQSKLFAEEQWQKAYAMLESNPSLMTGGILVLALKRRAPVNLIRFMLKLNSDAASIPSKGPSPLQIAVQNKCSVEVVQALIQACPFALVATNPGSYLDPLSYAKRFHPAETDLIQLLSRPVSHWIKSDMKSAPKVSSSSSSYPFKQSAKPSHSSLSLCGSEATHVVTPSNDTSSSMLSRWDIKEINNVKVICLATLKGYKRLANELSQVQNQINEVATASSAAIDDASLLMQKQIKIEDINKILRVHSTSLLGEMGQLQKEMSNVLKSNEEVLRQDIEKLDGRVLQRLQKHKDGLAVHFEARLNSVVQGLQGRLKVFSHKIDAIEDRQMNDKNRSQRIKNKSGPVNPPFREDWMLVDSKTNAWKTTSIITPESFTYRDASTFASYESDDDSPMPFVYASPFKKIPNLEEDTQSLLTDETSFNRQATRRVSKRKSGRYLLRILCKH